MRRVESSDGLDARTPTASITRQSTPGSVEKHGTSLRPSSPSDLSSVVQSQSHPHSVETRRAWKALNVKYYELGRSLKHEAQSLLQQTQQQSSPSTSTSNSEKAKLATLLSIEALSAFMLNHAFLSLANNGSDPGWRTILPYLAFVSRTARPYPQLAGLVAQLGAVCRQTILRCDLERLAREPLPDEHAPSAPTPGSDGTARPVAAAGGGDDGAEKAKRRWNVLRSELGENARELQRAWLEGVLKLGVDTLKDELPECWRGRSRDPGLKGASGVEKLSPETWARDGGYYLPLDANSGVVEGVRLAREVAREWARREGVGWTSRLEMG
jgi:hypothetical protein